MADETKLKPCPFCGGEAIISQYGDRRKSTIVECTECGCILENGETFRHGSSWNTRATMDKADMARTLQRLIKTEGLDAAYVWLGEVATGADEPEFIRPGDVIHDT